MCYRFIRNSMKRLILFFGFVLAAATAVAQNGAPVWTNRFADGRDDYPRGIAVDGNGNIFVTGESDYGGFESDYLTVAYSSTGARLWTNRYTGPVSGLHAARAIAVDSSGNVFVTGFSASSSFSPFNYDYSTVKYSGAGAPLWTNRYTGFNNGGADTPSAVVVDGNGNVFVTGVSQASGSPPGSYYSDFATVAYSGSGGQLWSARYSGSGGTNFANAIAVDGNGNVFVTGGTAPLGGKFDYATIGYSSSGAQMWARSYNGPGDDTDIARGIAVDGDGNVFVTGYSTNAGSGYDYTTVKYAGDGTPLWINRYNGTGNGDDYAVALAVDRNGNVFVTGYSVGSGTFFDYATVAYSGAGTPLWTNRYAGPSGINNRAVAVAVDSSGNVFVTGYSSAFNYVTVAYSGAGVALWTNSYSTRQFPNLQATALAVDPRGNVIVTGYASLTPFGSPGYATIKYSAFVASPYLGYQNVNNELILSWTNAGFNLQSAPTVNGTFTNLAGATSPYTNIMMDGQQFFRLISN